MRQVISYGRKTTVRSDVKASLLNGSRAPNCSDLEQPASRAILVLCFDAAQLSHKKHSEAEKDEGS